MVERGRYTVVVRGEKLDDPIERIELIRLLGRQGYRATVINDSLERYKSFNELPELLSTYEDFNEYGQSAGESIGMINSTWNVLRRYQNTIEDQLNNFGVSRVLIDDPYRKPQSTKVDVFTLHAAVEAGILEDRSIPDMGRRRIGLAASFAEDRIAAFIAEQAEPRG